MPIKEFMCPKCKRIVEKLILLGDMVEAECPQCGMILTETIISPCTFELKGGGWYADGYSRRKE